jgi:hypothetical protein
MSSLYTPFFEVLQNNHTVSGAANNQTFVLRKSNAGIVASKNVGFGPATVGGLNEIQFVGSNTVTFSSVSNDFDGLMVKTEMGSSTSLVNTVLFTFSTKSPNGNNVELNTAKVSFPSANEGLFRMAIENWSDPAHRVQLIDSGGTAQDHSDDEAFTVDPGQSEVTSDNSPIRVSAGSSYTADKDRVQYASNTLGGFVDMSTGTLSGNSISLNSGDAVEITGSPAITTSISL